MKRESVFLFVVSAVSLFLIGACLYVAYKALDYRRHVNYFLDKYTNVVSEYSGRQKYEADNNRLISSESNPMRIVFLGDQIIESWELSQYFGNYEAINRGLTGQRLSGFILRLRPDVLELNPRVAVIQFSSYNFRPQGTVKEVKDHIIDIAELCRYNNIEPILTTVIPVRKKQDAYEAEGFESYAVSDTLRQFNDWLREYCRLNDYRLIDFDNALCDDSGYLPEELSIDNTHLSKAGFERLAEVTIESLKGLDWITAYQFQRGSR